MAARHVRKGDQVMITAGSHKGQVGEISRVLVKRDRVIVKGVNLQTKHVKPNRLVPQGSIITKEASIHISNVSPVVDGMPTRVRFQINSDGSKDRIAVRGGKSLGQIAPAKKK